MIDTHYNAFEKSAASPKENMKQSKTKLKLQYATFGNQASGCLTLQISPLCSASHASPYSAILFLSHLNSAQHFSISSKF